MRSANEGGMSADKRVGGNKQKQSSHRSLPTLVACGQRFWCPPKQLISALDLRPTVLVLDQASSSGHLAFALAAARASCSSRYSPPLSRSPSSFPPLLSPARSPVSRTHSLYRSRVFHHMTTNKPVKFLRRGEIPGIPRWQCCWL